MPKAHEILLAVALRDEAQGLFEKAGVSVLYTGLGKVNAAYALTRALAAAENKNVTTVLNFGTAGSRVHATGELIACSRFVQRDMDVHELGFALGVTPFEDTPLVLEHLPIFTSLKQGVCGTGDSFETGAAKVACDVVDMEAYALAKVAKSFGVRFGCAKYITDGADASAANDWQANLPKAAAAFLTLYQHLLQNIVDR